MLWVAIWLQALFSDPDLAPGPRPPSREDNGDPGHMPTPPLPSAG